MDTGNRYAVVGTARSAGTKVVLTLPRRAPAYRMTGAFDFLVDAQGDNRLGEADNSWLDIRDWAPNRGWFTYRQTNG